MRTISDPRDARAMLDQVRLGGATIGFMPTLGYMHEGHAANIRAARLGTDFTVVSIFLNPTQFGPNEDLERYPRDDARDDAICEAEGVDLIIRPSVQAIYPDGPQLSIEVGEIGDKLCGASRPGHFNGVATVVAKLFNIVGPCRGYFGEKDFQQLVILERLVEAFHFPVEIIRCPTIREPDGLAMSSRNAYLSEAERNAARIIPEALFDATERVASGERDAEVLVSEVRAKIESKPLARVDYVSCVDPSTLSDLVRIKGRAVLAAAVHFPSARLIDNILLDGGAREGTASPA